MGQICNIAQISYVIASACSYSMILFFNMVAVSGVYLLHFIRKPKVIAHSRKHSSYISCSSLISERNWFSSRAERYYPWLHLQIGLSDAGMQCTQAASSSCSLTVDCEDAYGKPYWPLVPCQQHFVSASWAQWCVTLRFSCALMMDAAILDHILLALPAWPV